MSKGQKKKKNVIQTVSEEATKFINFNLQKKFLVTKRKKV